MFTNYNSNPLDAKHYDTARLRDEFLNDKLFEEDKITLLYSHIDRVVALGVCPSTTSLALDSFIDNNVFGTQHFLERREIGMVNLGNSSIEVTTASNTYTLGYLDALYLGMGESNVSFRSLDEGQPATLYCLSAPAHCQYPSRKINHEEARVVELGSSENANQRVINQYLHPDVLPTCQLCMGVTHLCPGSVWNTMPAHTHERRMEAYLYFNIKPEQVVFHFMGEPQETRHIIVRDKQLVLSPSWSIHSGCGTSNYSFVWGMLGENQTFDDMDFIEMSAIR
ncbi:5-keto-4-deoxyuronate isomerase [Photobacterium gaetbulicola]|uniref:4-deoxy-L-threo-5-hexosulose-uronate ketol-isomerase n=1 Tax=Photobacterium gaetbulicola TaxID=1295392 RepID=A0A0B9G8H4_9GAMM|nr:MULTISPECIES: 5-dehydro-4-deoxy-D-glucuronate isomerase [Photobacterium]KHT65018.1 5-keto-4-deoxyuronate isomerase [Photobacterium gaetbulicola]WEM44722.1 5-dehydro-4-deoxy-D-glucuronate isomerase [Photobacterium sp. DA100]